MPNTTVIMPGDFARRSEPYSPPPAPPPEPMPRILWTEWIKAMREMSDRPGWTPCQVGLQSAQGGTMFFAAATFGALSVHNSPLQCHECDDTGRWFPGTKLFSVVSHIFTGGQLGIFSDRLTAQIFAELASRTSDWHAVYDDKLCEPMAVAAHQAFRAMGGNVHPHLHVHFGGVPEPVLFLATGEKPEVLS